MYGEESAGPRRERKKEPGCRARARARAAHERNSVKSGDPSWRANCRRNSLVLVERGNPTYNFVRLQEGKLGGGRHARARAHYVRTHIRV